MEDGNQVGSARVGIYVKPGTRNRLNKFKADISYASETIIPLDEAINMLLDHYIATAPRPSKRVIEFA